MHLGGLLSTQEARAALGDSYASFVLSNLRRASITPWLHAARLPFLNYVNTNLAIDHFVSKITWIIERQSYETTLSLVKSA